MISPSVMLGFLFSTINENGVFTARKTAYKPPVAYTPFFTSCYSEIPVRIESS
jgi:hypothetical protein